MNKIEVLKAEKDGLDIKENIARYAELGWEAISEEDIQRLKMVWGVFKKSYAWVLHGSCENSWRANQLRSKFVRWDISPKPMETDCWILTTRQQFQLRQLKIEHVPKAYSSAWKKPD